MAQSLSMGLRSRLSAAVDDGMSCRGAAARFGVAPSTATEAGLVEIWSRLLGVEADRIGTQSDFFALGGHSLLSVRLVAEVRTGLGVELSIRDVFGIRVEELEPCFCNACRVINRICPTARCGGLKPTLRKATAGEALRLIRIHRRTRAD